MQVHTSYSNETKIKLASDIKKHVALALGLGLQRGQRNTFDKVTLLKLMPQFLVMRTEDLHQKSHSNRDCSAAVGDGPVSLGVD